MTKSRVLLAEKNIKRYFLAIFQIKKLSEELGGDIGSFFSSTTYLSRNFLNGSALKWLKISSIYGCKVSIRFKIERKKNCASRYYLLLISRDAIKKIRKGPTSNKLTGTSFFIRYLWTWDTASDEYSWNQKCISYWLKR